jgi:peptide/nickel transport system substrate-binding protein
MPERFGLKDFLVLACVAALGVIVLLKMWQDDRAWDKLQSLQTELQEQRRMIAALSATHPNSTPHAEIDYDSAWAVPGVSITCLTPRTHPSDPCAEPSFNPGGTLTEAIGADPARFTPYLYDSSYGQRIVDLVCEPLVVRDVATLEDRAALASAYQSDPDGLWCRVRLDANARFSDGTPVTAEDVRWTFHDFVMHPAYDAERWQGALGVIDRVVVLNKRTVEFRFHKPEFRNHEAALRMLSVLPKHIYAPLPPETVTASPGLLFGSGPFRLSPQPWRTGEPVELVRNEFYDRPDVPVFDRLRFVTITDKAARLEAIKNAEVDIARPNAAQLDAWSRDPTLANAHHLLAWENAFSGFTFITWNCSRAPFDDPRVRRAMTMLLDRDRIVRDLYTGLGTVCTGPFSVRAGQGDPTLRAIPFDIDQARSLLMQAGWSDNKGVLENAAGEPFRFTYTHASGSSSGPRLGAYMQDQCAKVGIACSVESVEFGTFWNNVRSGAYDAASMKWRRASTETDPHQLWHAESPDNISRWGSDAADRLIELGRATTDPEQRTATWHQLHAIIQDAQPFTFLVNTYDLRIVHGRIENVSTHPGGLYTAEMFAPLGDAE